MKENKDLITFRGTVVESSPGARFKVKLDNSHVIKASISGKIRKNNIQILLNDVVSVEMSCYDLDNGRIIYRF